ncbi:MAG: glycosyltransferase family 2 protein, partial [Lacipirellulaceae bacterium]
MNQSELDLEEPGFRFLTALPVFNEESHVDEVLDKVRNYASDILVVNDGSSDGTGERLAARNDIAVVTHETNQGYGAALKTAFEYAIVHRYDVLVTIDCDGQHEPQRIQALVNACDPTVSEPVDIVSGSRYLDPAAKKKSAPRDRRRINLQITEEMNCRFGLNLTDSFCGFKAYRVQSLAKLDLKETGYAMPLELW